MLGQTTDTDLAPDQRLPLVLPVQVPELITGNARPEWAAWWEAAMVQYRQSCRDAEMHRSMASCEALAGTHAALLLNRLREPLMGWLSAPAIHAPEASSFAARLMVEAAEAAHGKRASKTTFYPSLVQWH